MKINPNEQLTEAKLRKIRKFILAEKDRDNTNELLDDLAPLVANAKAPNADDDGKAIPRMIESHLVEMASTILYDGRQHTALMKVERLGEWAVLKDMPDDDLRAEIADLTRGHSVPTDPDKARYLIALREENSIRRQHKDVDNRIADAQASNEAVNSREAIQARLDAQQDYDRLSAETTHSMTPEQHQRHFNDLFNAARKSSQDTQVIYDIRDRQKREGDKIVGDQKQVFDNASELMRQQYGIKECSYDVDASIRRNLEHKPTQAYLDAQAKQEKEDAHVEEQRTEYNRRQMQGEKQRSFDPDLVKRQFNHEQGDAPAGDTGTKSVADMSLAEFQQSLSSGN